MAKLTLKKEQIDAINHNNGNILVSASAGSGKTFVMIERLIRLIVENQTSVENVLAMTFTESAAAEMKEKLKKALCDKINEGQKELTDQLALVPTADISTIHSFCGKLIRKYFYVTGVSPDFSICDEQQSSLLKARAINGVFSSLYESGESWFYDLFDKYASKRFDTTLKEVVDTVYDFIISEENPKELLYKGLETYTVDGHLQLKRKFKEEIIDQKVKSYISATQKLQEKCGQYSLVKGVAFCDKMLDKMQDALSCDINGLTNVALSLLRLNFDKVEDIELIKIKESVQTVNKNFNALIKEGVEYLKEDFNSIIDCKQTAENLAKLVLAVKESYDSLKGEENLLDFNDLEHFALATLQDETVRDDVASKYKFVFVDEYQDTNGVQEAILKLINKDNVFMVGDEKQCIYAFRGCRPEFFRTKYGVMKKDGQATVDLNYNFRSAPKILDAVNEIFNYSMTEKEYGLNYKNTQQLKAGGVYPEEAGGKVKLHFFREKGRTKAGEELPRIYDVLEEFNALKEDKKVADVSSLISKIIYDELGTKYYDFKSKTYKTVTLNDIVVLDYHKKGSYVEKLVKGLVAHGIPVTSGVKQNICEYPEIDVLINALKLIDSFQQDIPLAITLKSVIGNFSEEDLAQIALKYKEIGEYDGFSKAYAHYLETESGELYDRLFAFNEYYKKLRSLADFYSAQDVLFKLVNDSDMETFCYAEKMGYSKVRHIRQFISLAVSGTKKYSVREFLSVIENSPEAFEVFEPIEEDTVRVMTIHASKGLEFPIVILAEAEGGISTRNLKSNVIYTREDGFALKRFDTENRTTNETLFRAYVRNKIHQNSIKEALRTFYVGTTRAKYGMHIVFSGTEDVRQSAFCDAKGYADFIPYTLPVEEHDVTDFDFIDFKQDVREVLFAETDEEFAKELKTRFAFNYPYQEETTLPLKTSVTGAVSRFNGETVYTYLEDDGSTGAERGIIAHKVMENLDFNNADFSAQIEKIKSTGILTEEQLSSINLERIKRVVSMGVLNDFTGTLYREKQFIANFSASEVFNVSSSEPVLIQGVIDLLAIDGTTAKIADYKYSLLDKDSLKKKYNKQLDLYASAVEKSTGKKVVKKVLINIYSGDVITLD
ncbi:MAG: UvrD-helicase domain-containing protein [Clostridia bacterium]|nr:UvrD-helicase domain-containing protein [Clostridia bacterium]